MNIDTELKLMAGLPISLNNGILVYPLNIREITSMGYTLYNSMLGTLVFDVDNNEDSNKTTYDILVENCSKDKDFMNLVLVGLGFFTRENVGFHNEYKVFSVGEKDNFKLLTKEDYEQFKDILKYQNCIKSMSEDEEFNPNDEKAKTIIEKLKKARQKLKKAKNQEDGETLSFADLISILSANGNNLNILNIWDLTMVQFNNQFNRMKMLEEYDINIRSLLAGAKSDDIDMKHWMSKIEDN